MNPIAAKTDTPICGLNREGGGSNADLSSPNTQFEVGMFLSRESRQANLIAIVEEGIPLPFDIAKIALIVRPREWSDQNHEFLRALANRLEALSRQLEPAREHEAMRLLEKKEYRAAVVAAFTQLEHDLT
jgi:hypothetical protein